MFKVFEQGYPQGGPQRMVVKKAYLDTSRVVVGFCKLSDCQFKFSQRAP